MINASNVACIVRERVRRIGRGEVGRLDIGIFGTAVIDYVPRLLSALAAGSPDLHVVLHNAPKAEQIEAVRQGHVLAAFDRNVPEEPDIEIEVAWREPMVVALPSLHRFAGHTVIEAALLADEAFIIGSGRIDPTRQTCRTAGFEPRVVAEMTDVMTVLPLVANGMGIALAPMSVSMVGFPGVSYPPLRNPSATFDLVCVQRAGESPRSSPPCAGRSPRSRATVRHRRRVKRETTLGRPPNSVATRSNTSLRQSRPAKPAHGRDAGGDPGITPSPHLVTSVSRVSGNIAMAMSVITLVITVYQAGAIGP